MKTRCRKHNIYAGSLLVIGLICGLTVVSSSCSAQQTSSNTVIGPGGSSPNLTTTSKNAGPSVVLPTGPASALANGLLTDTVETKLGQPVDHLTFTVTNKTHAPVEYEFKNGQQCDFIITDAMGKKVWTWSHARIFTQLITHLTLNPNQSRVYTATWNRRDQNDKPVPPGKYNAVAIMTSQPRLMISKTTTLNPVEENRDPTNVNLPSPESQEHSAEYGGEEQSDVAPPVKAKTTIIVAPQP